MTPTGYTYTQAKPRPLACIKNTACIRDPASISGLASIFKKFSNLTYGCYNEAQFLFQDLHIMEKYLKFSLDTELLILSCIAPMY